MIWKCLKSNWVQSFMSNFIQLTDQYNRAIILNKYHISSVEMSSDDPKLALVYLNNGQFHYVLGNISQLKGILNGKE
jgi:hypothetical protein